MDRFIAVIACVACFASISFAGPIHSEYGVPFDTYGPPASEIIHSPLHRTVDLPPIELPPPVSRIFIPEEAPLKPLQRSFDLPPLELPPPVQKIIISEVQPIDYVPELSPIELPPPIQTIPEEYPIIHHEVLPLELPPPVDIIVRSEAPAFVPESVALELPAPVKLNVIVPEVRSPVIKPKIVIKGEEVVAPPNTKVHLIDGKNQYSVGFQNPDGTEVNEQGRLISTDNGWEYVIAKTGSYRYVSPEGIPVSVNWVADEKGFRILSNDA